MSIFWGFFMFCFGGAGTYMSWTYMENDRRYTYRPPLTDHESTVIAIFTVCLIVAVVGLLITVFSIIKKRNEDSLAKLVNTTNGSNQKNVCVYCGLNLMEGSTVCPKCGKTVNQTGGKEIGKNNN